jgi:hypothetical protein
MLKIHLIQIGLWPWGSFTNNQVQFLKMASISSSMQVLFHLSSIIALEKVIDGIVPSTRLM